MSDANKSRRLLTKNERMSESLIFLANEQFAHFSQENKWFAQKTDERIPNPVLDGICIYSTLYSIKRAAEWFHIFPISPIKDKNVQQKNSNIIYRRGEM